MLSQHFCQLLAAKALCNCAATLDKMNAAVTDQSSCQYKPNKTLDWLSVCQDTTVPQACPKPCRLLMVAVKQSWRKKTEKVVSWNDEARYASNDHPLGCF